MQAVIVQVFCMCYITRGVSHGEGPWCAASAATHVRLRSENGDEIETWHAGGGRLSHHGGCVVERAHVCHKASAHVPHDRPVDATHRLWTNLSCAGAAGTFVAPRVRWSSCPTFNSSKPRHSFVLPGSVKGKTSYGFNDSLAKYLSLWWVILVGK